MLKLDHTFLLGLCLFVRQLQLSIDRSYNDEWELLLRYFEKKTKIEVVLERLRVECYFDIEKLGKIGIERSDLNRSKVKFICMATNSVSEKELSFIFSRLEIVSKIFSSKKNPQKSELISLRMDLEFSERLLKSRIKNRASKLINYVEHFNQNPNLECRSIEEIVKEPWL